MSEMPAGGRAGPLDLSTLPLPAARASGRSGRLFDIACAGLLALFFLVIASLAVIYPEREWDMVAYVALAIEDDADAAEDLHRASWELVRRNTSQDAFDRLTGGDDYRRAQYDEAANFVSQLPMYRMKVGYVALIRLLSPVTGPVAAMQWINAASALVLGAVLLGALWRAGIAQGGLLLAPFMMVTGLVPMVRLATPDLAVAALAIGGFVLLCNRRARWAAVPVLVAGFLVRPDMIVFMFALLLASQLLAWNRLPVLVSFALAAVLLVPLTTGAGHLGWWPHFWFSTVAVQHNLEGFQPPFSISVYLTGLGRGLALSIIHHNWLAIGIMLFLAGCLLLRERPVLARHSAAAMLAAVLAVGGKFVLFPLPDDRIYAAALWLFALALAWHWRPRLLT